MYQYILFDLDGTIINSAEGIINCVRYALEDFGITEEDDEKLKAFIGPPLVDSFQEFYHFSEEEAKKATEKYRERYRDKGIFEIEMYDGIEEVFHILKERKKTIALATSKPEVFATRIMEKLGLISYIDVITGSEFDGRRDKKEDVLEEVFLRLGNPKPEEVLMIGDRKFDIIGAKAWGVDSVGVTYGFAPEGELEEYGATYIADSPDEILDYVR